MPFIVFSEQMIDLLAQIKGHTLNSFALVQEATTHEHDMVAYAKLCISATDLRIELINDHHLLDFGGYSEEYAGFQLRNMRDDEEFIPLHGAEDLVLVNVGSMIRSVSVIRDTIRVKNRDDEFEITFDMAIDIKTDAARYVLSKDWFFAVEINVDKDRSFDEIYPVEKVRSDWYDEDHAPMTIDVKREIIEL